MKPIRETYTFDDVLLVPKRSSVFSRRDVSTQTKLTATISLKMPIVAANMDTVTESRMARFMAEAGGIGIIHRFLSIERQAAEVRKVKRAESVIIDDPYTILAEKTVADAERFMHEYNISGLPVVDATKKIIGIITHRDTMFVEDKKTPIASIMTKRVITAPRRISLKSAKELLFKHHIEKLPLITPRGILIGLMVLKDIMRENAPSFASKDKKGRLLVGAAVGVKEETLSRARALLDAGVDVLVLDIAHGQNKRALETIKLLKKKLKGVEIIGGNVATREGVADLIRAGADGIKIGVGPGAACTTRIVTGVGIPQLSAIMDAAAMGTRAYVPLIADGGIQSSGDLAKALAAGASTAMIGSLLAGCDEAPGEYILEDGLGYKLYRGMASRDASDEKVRIDGGGDGAYRAPEGKSGKVPYRGHAKNVVEELLSGLRSSMSYLGARTITEFQKNAEFVHITPAGLRESHAHNIK